MKFYDRKFEMKRREWEQDWNNHDDHFKKRKKQRREKYKPKNQKFHQLDYEDDMIDFI
ncbi:MAG: hypothetical protein KatS3mg031_0033 [Chitinophagales bacterium]|nr:MAG: hypothetical protein KatS3mg031_0033 [Chitinophagales bacterium]